MCPFIAPLALLLPPQIWHFYLPNPFVVLLLLHPQCPDLVFLAQNPFNPITAPSPPLGMGSSERSTLIQAPREYSPLNPPMSMPPR